MADSTLVPDDFTIPLSLVTGSFRLEPLGPQHNADDHVAWTSSIEHIQATPGFAGRSWPPAEGMTLAENLGDLQRHAEDFMQRTGFTFTVLDASDGTVIGCVYIYPAQNDEWDADVKSWVRADRADLDGPLHQAVTTWLSEDWPFSHINYASRDARST
jgi:hypothetical protein